MLHKVATEGSDSNESLTSYLESASNSVDKHCRRGDRAFLPTDANVVRQFLGSGTDWLAVDGFYTAAMTQTEPAITFGVADDNQRAVVCTPFPLNKEQFVYLRKFDGSIWEEHRLYSVDARYGIAETPSDIVIAVKQLTDLQRVAGPLSIASYSTDRTETVTMQARQILNRLLNNWRVNR